MICFHQVSWFKAIIKKNFLLIFFFRNFNLRNQAFKPLIRITIPWRIRFLEILTQINLYKYKYSYIYLSFSTIRQKKIRADSPPYTPIKHRLCQYNKRFLQVYIIQLEKEANCTIRHPPVIQFIRPKSFYHFIVFILSIEEETNPQLKNQTLTNYFFYLVFLKDNRSKFLSA